MQVILLILIFAYFSLLLLFACLYLLLAGPDARARRRTAAVGRRLAAAAEGKPVRFAEMKRLGGCDEAAASLIKGYTALKAEFPERAEALLPQIYVLLSGEERRCPPSDVSGRLFYLRLLEELEPDRARYRKRLAELPECLLVSCEHGAAMEKAVVPGTTPTKSPIRSIRRVSPKTAGRAPGVPVNFL
ncbi:MAG TPA: hypothetical protein PLU75_03765 [Oscillospiraceae bacterium]|nr:hypothetical protein [Oscillospiraceae bacterium]HRW57604.1 hypothetical protein [Oscillospiraceae bacterium]